MPSASYGQSSGYSTSSPGSVNSAQSDWGLDLSRMLASLGQAQYSWALGEYDKGMQFTGENIQRYLHTAGQASELATNLLGRYRDVFEPIMNKFIEQAGSYNSEARQRFKMGEAESTVSQAMNAGADEAERKLQSFGIDPSSGRYQDQILASRIQRAAAMAGAGTQASVNTAAIGRNMTQQAAQMGQNVPGMTVNALGAGVNALQGAQGAMQGMLQTGAQLTSSAAPFFNSAASANHLPPVGNTSQSRQGSQNRSQNVEAGQGSGGQGNKGQQNPGQTGGREGPGPSRGGQYRQADPNRQVRGGQMQNVGNGGAKIMNDLDPLSQIQPWNDGQEDNPLYNPAAWDYLQEQTGTQGQTPWNEPDWWNNDTIATGQDLANGGTGREGLQNFDDFGGIDDGNVFNGRQMDSRTDPNSVFDTSQRNQEVPFYDPTTPSVDPSNPWEGVGNPLQDDYTGSINNDQFGQFNDQTNTNGGDFDWGDWYNQQNGGGYDPTQQDYGGQGNYNQGQYGNYNGGNYQGSAQGNYQPQEQGGWGQYNNEQSSGGGADYGNYNGGGYYGSYAKGGQVKGRQQRGMIPSNRQVKPGMSPSRGKQTDDVSARLNVGEFVVPKDVVAHKGSEFFANLIKKSRMARTGQQGPEPKPKMKPALRMRPQFVSDRV